MPIIYDGQESEPEEQMGRRVRLMRWSSDRPHQSRYEAAVVAGVSLGYDMVADALSALLCAVTGIYSALRSCVSATL